MLGSMTATGNGKEHFYSSLAAGAQLRRDPPGDHGGHRIVGAAGGLLAVLVPLLLSTRADVTELRRDLHAMEERVVRIEGALTGLWRPANGTPNPIPGTQAPTAAP